MQDNQHNTTPPCIASFRRIQWAVLRSGRTRAGFYAEPYEIGLYAMDMDDARALCDEAGVPLAALYLPDPTRRERLAARLHGWKLRALTADQETTR